MNGGTSTQKINFDEVHDLALKLSKEPPFTTDNIYVDLLLTIAAKEIQAKFDFILKGGTAILKTNGPAYRFSYDLDFSFFPKEGKARKHYKYYKDSLEKFVNDLGFEIVDEIEKDTGRKGTRHREGGRIFILHLMDGKEYLKRPIKLSISSIDEAPCHSPESKLFKTIVDIPSQKFSLLYPNLVPGINQINVKILVPEELCAEKIRALATRGGKGEWSFLLRDAVDLYMMDKSKLLDRVFKNHKNYIKQKFSSIKDRSYWQKFESFMIAGDQKISISEESRAIFFDPNVINEEKTKYIVNKIKKHLKPVYEELSSGDPPKPGLVERFFKGISKIK